MWFYFVLGGIAMFFLTITIISYQQSKKASIRLEVEEFKKNLRKSQLIDVRTKKEFATGHINGARNISVQMITREYQKLRKDQPIYLYCQSGKRSNRTAVLLKAKGFNELYQLKNGLNSWNGPLK